VLLADFQYLCHLIPTLYSYNSSGIAAKRSGASRNKTVPARPSDLCVSEGRSLPGSWRGRELILVDHLGPPAESQKGHVEKN
jgi:hypothetical protein